MTLTFITNYMTHHQLPFCDELYALLGKDFHFLATNRMEDERIKMGWGAELRDLPYALFYDDDYDLSHKLIRESDVVICGGTHHSYIEERLVLHKLTFRYFERLYKDGRIKAFIPSSYRQKKKEHTAYNDDPVYLLCAGAYVAADFDMFSGYKDKKLRFGYFPEFVKEDTDKLFESKSENVTEIMWSGRMLEWKHPGAAVYTASYLKDRGVPFHMTIVGEGECRERIDKAVKSKDLSSSVTVLDFEKPFEIRKRMEKSDIYLMTSDQKEGWGAVVNEAMNSGCAVVASHAAGAVPYLIKHGENGLVYRSGDLRELASHTAGLCRDSGLRRRLGMAAYNTIEKEWNPHVAAVRLMEMSEKLLADPGTDLSSVFHDGPMSAAPSLTVAKGYRYLR